jgi:hypothetical protein
MLESIVQSCSLPGISNRVFSAMAALQIRAIPMVSLWFAPCPDPKSIGFHYAIQGAALHLRIHRLPGCGQPLTS